jgi:NADPH:quinone reductase-like Zn-dependent oxidoreductase
MKGWVAGPQLREDLPEPAADTIVAVKASSLNALDLRLDGVLGCDFAGVVEADGSEVFGFLVGGAWVERLAAGPFLAPRPSSLSLAEAGACAAAGTFALAYVESLSLSGGERVLVVGANGGAGAFAVQLCVAFGASVVAPALEIDAAYLQGLGVSEVVPRDARPEADHVIDFVSPAAGVSALSDPGRVARLGALIDEHSIRVPICEGFSFGQVPEAMEAFREHKQGKLSVV